MARRRAQATPDASRKVALIYVRVSRFTKKDEGRKVSPQTQLERCKALPALDGHTIEQFEDLDFSGKNTDRPGFQAMMERAGKGDVAVVACYSLSRLSRSLVDFYDTIHALDEVGVKFISATENIDTTTAMGRMVMGILATLAQFERELLAERVTDALATKKEHGWVGGQPPVGYRREGKGWAVDDRWAVTVVEIFEAYASGQFSTETLARHLNAEEVASPMDHPTRNQNRRGKVQWHGGAIKAMLENRTYLGENKEGLAAPFAAIVSRELWDRAQAIRVSNRRRRTQHLGRRSVHALSGLATCNRCGGRLRYRGPTKRGPAYYRCANVEQGGACDLPWIPAGELEESIRKSLSNLAAPGQSTAGAVKRLEVGLRRAPSPRAALEAQLKGLDNRLKALSFQHEHRGISDEDYAGRVDRLNAEKQTVTDQFDRAPKVDLEQGQERLTSLVKAWEAIGDDGTQRNHLLGEVADRIIVDRQRQGRRTALISVIVVPTAAWSPFFHLVHHDLKPSNRAVVALTEGGSGVGARSKGQLSAKGGSVTLEVSRS